MLLASIIGPLIAIRGPHAGASYLLATTSLFAVAAIGTAWLLACVLREPPSNPTVDLSPVRQRGLSGVGFWLLVTSMFVISAFTQVFPKLEPYFAAYALRSAWWGGIVMVLMAAGIFAGQLLWLHLSRLFPRGIVMALAALTQILALAVFGSAGTISPAAAALSAVAFGFGNGGVGMIQWAAFTEMVASQPASRVGMSYGLFAASGKIGLAVGGLTLSAIVASADLDGSGNAKLLARLMATIPALGAFLVAMLAVGLFSGDRRRSAAIPSGK